MSKLRYYYGCMGSSKSATLLMKAYQFEQSGLNVIIMKPRFDTRDDGIIKPRPMPGRKCITFGAGSDLYFLVKQEASNSNKRSVVFIDEIQFVSESNILQLWEVTKDLGIDVFCYGLRVNYLNQLFTSIKSLEVLADTQEELKSMCKHCTNKATTHIRYINDIPQTSGESTIIGDLVGTEYYESVCQECRREIFRRN